MKFGSNIIHFIYKYIFINSDRGRIFNLHLQPFSKEFSIFFIKIRLKLRLFERKSMKITTRPLKIFTTFILKHNSTNFNNLQLNQHITICLNKFSRNLGSNGVEMVTKW